MKKYRLFGKIPVFDLFIIIVLLIVAVLGYKIINSSKSGNAYLGTETKDVVLTVRFSNSPLVVNAEPEVGEKVIDNTTNTHLGEVVSYEVEPYTLYDASFEDGKTVATVCEDRKNIYVKFSAKANMSDVGSDINGVKIGIGKTLTFSMPSICASGVITNIEVNG